MTNLGIWSDSTKGTYYAIIADMCFSVNDGKFIHLNHKNLLFLYSLFLTFYSYFSS